MEQEKRKVGRKAGVKIGTYANHKKPEDRAKRKPMICIVGEQEKLDKIRQLANESGKTISDYVLDKILEQ